MHTITKTVHCSYEKFSKLTQEYLQNVQNGVDTAVSQGKREKDLKKVRIYRNRCLLRKTGRKMYNKYGLQLVTAWIIP